MANVRSVMFWNVISPRLGT